LYPLSLRISASPSSLSDFLGSKRQYNTPISAKRNSKKKNQNGPVNFHQSVDPEQELITIRFSKHPDHAAFVRLCSK
jgi:hypothetical protein